MRAVLLFIFVMILAKGTIAQDAASFAAVVTTSFESYGVTVPAGATIEVTTCLSEGEKCIATYNGTVVMVPGTSAIRDYNGKRIALKEAEVRIWAAIRAADGARQAAAVPVASSAPPVGIRTEGDSFIAGAYGFNLHDYLQTRLQVLVTNTAKGGSTLEEARDRVLAAENAGLLSRPTIIWDGSPNGFTALPEYLKAMQEMISALGHDRFIIIPPAPPADASNVTLENAIAAEFKKRWPDNYLDWRDVLPNDNGIIHDDQFAKYPDDKTHLGEVALTSMASAIGDMITAKGWLK